MHVTERGVLEMLSLYGVQVDDVTFTQALLATGRQEETTQGKKNEPIAQKMLKIRMSCGL